MIEAFMDVVGLSRREVAVALVERFDLFDTAAKLADDFGVSTPWQAFVQVRLNIYKKILADPAVIKQNQWSHTMALLASARENDCKVGLATMSYCQQASRVLDILELRDRFDYVATRDDVENGKPDPEIYLLVAGELEVDPGDCLVIEDSPTGVQAALNAGMHVVAVSTPFTKNGLRASGLLPEGHIVDSPSELLKVVDHVIRHSE